jgi:hypothetical protein
MKSPAQSLQDINIDPLRFPGLNMRDRRLANASLVAQRSLRQSCAFSEIT